MKIYNLFFLFILLISCKQENKHYLERFDKIIESKHSIIKLKGNNVYYKVLDINYINNKIVALDLDEQTFLSVTDLNKQMIVSRFCKKGQGPNELIGWPMNITKIGEDKIRFYVGNNDRYFDADIQTPNNPKIDSNKNFEFNTGVIAAISLTEGYSLVLGGLEKGQYSLIDSMGNQLSIFSEYPRFDGDDKFTNNHKKMAFQGDLFRHPNGNRVCFTGRISEIIDIIGFNPTKKELSKIFSWQGELGKFVPEGDGTKVSAAAIKRESKVTFLNSAATEKFIYLLYSGRVIGQQIDRAFNGNTVFVLDWEGKPVARYNLDIDVKCIAVSDDDKTLYAIAEQEDTNLVKFKLNH